MQAQGSQAHAYEDTVGLWLDGDLVTDLSQHGEDLTASGVGPNYGGTGAYRSSDAIRQILDGDGGREIYVRAIFSRADVDGVLVALGPPDDGSAAAWALVLSSQTITALVDGSPVGSCPLVLNPTLEQSHSIRWSSRPNPDATGPSDALIGEITVFGHDDLEFEAPAHFTHGVSTVAGDHAFMIGGYGGADGEPWSSDVREVTICRVGKAWRSSSEWAEEWIFTRPTHSTALPMHEPLPVPTWPSGVGDAGQWAGQANIGVVAAEGNRRARSLWGPLVNEAYSDAQPFGIAEEPAAWYRGAPGDASWRLCIRLLRHVPVPRGATHAWVRMHFVQFAVEGGDPVPLEFRCYAMNRPFGVGPLGGEPLEWAATAGSLIMEQEHGENGVGQWLTLGLVRLPIYTGPAPGWRDTVHLVLATRWDGEGLAAAPELGRCKIKAWHVRPIYKPIGGPLGDP